MEQMDEFPGVDAVPVPEIPDKLVFRIGEVSQMLGVEPYVLRYWESEFRGLSPKKSSSGQRMFRKKDVELLLRIRHLLYERKFTIEGARKVLAERGSARGSRKEDSVAQQELFAGDGPVDAGEPCFESDSLSEIRREVAEILKLIS
jgi:DNA-binding transcriptional MerR regulator